MATNPSNLNTRSLDLTPLGAGGGTLPKQEANLMAPLPFTNSPLKSTFFGQMPILDQTTLAIQCPLTSQLSAQLNAFVEVLSKLVNSIASISMPDLQNSFNRTSPLTNSRRNIAFSGKVINNGFITPHQPVIAQIDDFTTDNTGFNHGEEVAKTLNPDGNTRLLEFNIGEGGDRLTNISNSLENIIIKLKRGETIDAVNLSQQDFGNSSEATQIRALLDEIDSMGVPVAVAAGNNGPNQKNDLASNRSFSVSSTTNGQLNPDSGIGNVTTEGRTTSFATAYFARQIAFRHAQSLNVMA